MICILKNNIENREYLLNEGYIALDESKPRYTWAIVSVDKKCFYPITTRYGNRIGLFDTYITCNNINEFEGAIIHNS